jgi:hypothetical protein
MRVFLIAITLVSSLVHAEELTTIDINNRLEAALDRVAEESRKEQQLTAGFMLVAGGALATAGIFGTIIGNDFSTPNAPAVYIAASGLVTAGGIMNLSRDNPFTESLKTFKALPQTKLEDFQVRIAYGQNLLREEAERARLWRIWGSWITVTAGGANILISSTTAPPSRTGFEVVGYTSVALGLTDLLVERRRWVGGSLFTLGMSNVINDRIDPGSPSSDYLLISGGIIVASGLLRLFTPTPAEKALDAFYDQVKGYSVNFFLTPIWGGYRANAQISF